MRKAQNMVKEFHLAVGLPVRGDDEDTYPDEERHLRSALIVEEIKEIIDGMINASQVEIADGLADTVYVAAGTAETFGVDVDMYRVAGCRRALAAAMEGIAAALRTPGKERLGLALKHLELVCKGIAREFEVPLYEVFIEVHRSNMTKLLHPHKEDCALLVKGMSYTDRRSGKTEWTRCDCGAVIYAENGKIMKPAGYEPPDVAGVLRKSQ